MSDPAPRLLLTGGTGFIGFQVLLMALAEGWKVRMAVRSIAASAWIMKHPKVVALGLTDDDSLSFAEVPDICTPNAYDEAVLGVSHVIHLASPLPSRSLEPVKGIYEPNIKSVAAMLSATRKNPLLKKLVITSSVFGNSPFPPVPSQRITPESREPNLPGPFDNIVSAYWGGKTAALNAIDAFIKDTHPSFSISIVFPGFVFGRDERALKLEDFLASTNRILLGVVTGQIDEDAMPAGAVDVTDAAKLHVLALRPDAPVNLGCTVPHVFEDAWDAVAKHFPAAVKDGVLTKGSLPTIPVNWDASETEAKLGFKFRTWEDMVVDTVGQYLELSGHERA
ncbi:putative cinnamoyl-CoA reductase [Nemania sp. FL0916]|nr:putative cinnamoyl-CoA reductase [Nemania sp. FL0916]